VPGSVGTEQLLANGALRLEPERADFDVLADRLIESVLPDKDDSAPHQELLF
jgi:hypothetical protein